MNRPEKQRLCRVLVGVPPNTQHYAVGETGPSGGIEEIIKSNSGRGPMGYYDCIHVYTEGAHLVFPAHFCIEWEVMLSKEDAFRLRGKE